MDIDSTLMAPVDDRQHLRRRHCHHLQHTSGYPSFPAHVEKVLRHSPNTLLYRVPFPSYFSLPIDSFLDASTRVQLHTLLGEYVAKIPRDTLGEDQADAVTAAVALKQAPGAAATLTFRDYLFVLGSLAQEVAADGTNERTKAFLVKFDNLLDDVFSRVMQEQARLTPDVAEQAGAQLLLHGEAAEHSARVPGLVDTLVSTEPPASADAAPLAADPCRVWYKDGLPLVWVDVAAHDRFLDTWEKERFRGMGESGGAAQVAVLDAAQLRLERERSPTAVVLALAPAHCLGVGARVGPLAATPQGTFAQHGVAAVQHSAPRSTQLAGMALAPHHCSAGHAQGQATSVADSTVTQELVRDAVGHGVLLTTVVTATPVEMQAVSAPFPKGVHEVRFAPQSWLLLLRTHHVSTAHPLTNAFYLHVCLGDGYAAFTRAHRDAFGCEYVPLNAEDHPLATSDGDGDGDVRAETRSPAHGGAVEGMALYAPVPAAGGTTPAQFDGADTCVSTGGTDTSLLPGVPVHRDMCCASNSGHVDLHYSVTRAPQRAEVLPDGRVSVVDTVVESMTQVASGASDAACEEVAAAQRLELQQALAQEALVMQDTLATLPTLPTLPTSSSAPTPAGALPVADASASGGTHTTTATPAPRRIAHVRASSRHRSRSPTTLRAAERALGLPPGSAEVGLSTHTAPPPTPALAPEADDMRGRVPRADDEVVDLDAEARAHGAREPQTNTGADDNAWRPHALMTGGQSFREATASLDTGAHGLAASVDGGGVAGRGAESSAGAGSSAVVRKARQERLSRLRDRSRGRASSHQRSPSPSPRRAPTRTLAAANGKVEVEAVAGEPSGGGSGVGLHTVATGVGKLGSDSGYESDDEAEVEAGVEAEVEGAMSDETQRQSQQHGQRRRQVRGRNQAANTSTSATTGTTGTRSARRSRSASRPGRSRSRGRHATSKATVRHSKRATGTDIQAADEGKAEPGDDQRTHKRVKRSATAPAAPPAAPAAPAAATDTGAANGPATASVEAADVSDGMLVLSVVRQHAQTTFAQLADMGRVDPLFASAEGVTALMVAAAHGVLDIAQQLLDMRAAVDAADANGYTALMHAAAAGYTHLCMMLVRAGANPTAVDALGNTALHHACAAHLSAPVRAYLQPGGAAAHASASEAPAGASDASDASATAAAEGSLSEAAAVTAVVASSGSGEGVGEGVAQPPPVSAAYAEHQHGGAGTGSHEVYLCRAVLVRALAKHCAVNAVNKSGNTALHLAATRGDAASVRVLLESGATTRIRNNARQTAQELATAPAAHRLLHLHALGLPGELFVEDAEGLLEPVAARAVGAPAAHVDEEAVALRAAAVARGLRDGRIHTSSRAPTRALESSVSEELLEDAEAVAQVVVAVERGASVSGSIEPDVVPTAVLQELEGEVRAAVARSEQAHAEAAEAAAASATERDDVGVDADADVGEEVDIWTALSDAQAMRLCVSDAAATGSLGLLAGLLRAADAAKQVAEEKLQRAARPSRRGKRGKSGPTATTAEEAEQAVAALPGVSTALLADGDTAMHVAARHNQWACLAYLAAKGADVDVKNKAGQTPLIVAALAGSVRALQWLLVHGADVSHVDRHGCTALAYSILAHHHAATFALARNGADLHAPDAYGNTPFLLAAAAGDVALCAELSSRGANVHHVNHRGENALGMAVRYAIVHGARVGTGMAGTRASTEASEGATAVEHADGPLCVGATGSSAVPPAPGLLEQLHCHCAMVGASPRQEQYLAVLRWLLLNSVHKSHRDSEGRTPASLATECGRADLAELLTVGVAATDTGTGSQ